MRGLFSEITTDRNKKKKGEKLSTEEPLDPETTGWEGRGKDSTFKLSRSANKLTNSVVTLLYILAYKSINSYSNAIT